MKLSRAAFSQVVPSVLLWPFIRPLASNADIPSAEAVLPLELCGGAYCMNYTIDKQLFRAVVDTGSPFILVDGTCDTPEARTLWGCYRGVGRPSGLAPTDELFGGIDVGTEWRRGTFIVGAGVRPSPVGWLTADLAQIASVEDAIFGVVRSAVDKGGGAVFLGLAKGRLPRIRPTFLEQTSVTAMRFNFIERTLALSSRPLIPRTEEAVRIIDLRPRGAPIATYAARLSRLVVNNQEIVLDRPTVVIIDTGCTGASICDELYDLEVLPTVWQDARIEIATEQGNLCAVEASVRRRRRSAPGIPPPRVGTDAPEFDEFPLIITPVHVPWFDPGFGEEECEDEHLQCRVGPISRRKSLLASWLARSDGLGDKPYVIFIGLAFLWQRELTIDIDSGRMRIV